MLANAECLETCASCGVTEYISAALGIGWDLIEGYLFPVDSRVQRDTGQGSVVSTADDSHAAGIGAPACSEAARSLHNALVSGGGFA